MNAEPIRNLVYQLRLYGVLHAFERRCEQAVADNQHPLELLRLVFEDELLARKERQAKTLVRRAKFRSNADLEDWDNTFERGLSKQKLTELSRLNFCERKENLLILGKTGEGKTHLAIALGRRACQEGMSVTFMPMNFLFEEAIASRAAGKYLGFVRRISQSGLLLLDDFGLRSYSHQEANVLIDLLEDRYQKGWVIVTSQIDPKGWRKLFEDEVIAEAIVDRLTHPAQTIVLRGGSYREKLTGHANKEETKKATN